MVVMKKCFDRIPGVHPPCPVLLTLPDGNPRGLSLLPIDLDFSSTNFSEIKVWRPAAQ
jgi:hypothetical protein